MPTPHPPHTPPTPPTPTTDTLFDALEPRCLLAFTVTNLNDIGAGSLRQAILDANAAAGADVINFNTSLDGTITLTSVLEVTDDLTINGPGQENVTVSGNEATRVLDVDSATTVAINGLTIANGAAGGAGGILNDGTLTLTNVTLSNNRATGFNGGGAIVNGGALTLAGCTFTGNDAGGWGGAIDNSGNLVVSNSTFRQNSADFDGGAILSNSSGSFLLLNSTLANNTAGSDGGGIWLAGSLDMNGCTLSANGGARGAGIFGGGSGGVRVIVNSTISGNAASDTGGGIFNVTGNVLNVDNSTITGNTAGADGGGVLSNGATRVRSSIIAGNSTDVTGSATLGVTSVFNLIGSASSAGGLTDGVNDNIVGADPLLAPLADNGGPALTHALLPGSPAIDAGANPGSLAFDQRGDGFPRLRGGAVDIGGIEFSTPPTITDLIPFPSTVARGGTLSVTASAVTPGDGPVARVEFYHDTNNNGVADDGELVHSDLTGENGYRFLLPSTLALPLGAVRFIAIAVAQDGTRSAPKDTEVTVTNAIPTIGTLTVSSPTFELGAVGTSLTAADPADADGTIAMVRFFADLNRNGVIDPGEQIGVDTNGTNGWSYTFDPGQSLEFPLGEVTFWAVSVDNDGVQSAPSSTTATTEFNIRAGPGRQVVGTADAADAPRVVTSSFDGHVIVFEDGWVVDDLQVMTGAPDAIGDAVVWVDPKDGLTYVSAPTSEGLLLFTRGADGAWTVRNLTTETGATESPTHGLTTFTSTQGVVGISGITASGRIVIFGQNLEQAPGGGPAFNFLDISGDLESQGMVTPRLSSLISYVPTWNSWHLAGIDDDGRIQSVWINKNVEGFTKWRVDDLTATTGAPALTGQLAVTLTSWGGINLTGLNDDGDLLTTWWVPEFGGDWRVNNLTQQFNGARYIGGNVSGFTTPWGGLNYVGLNEEGRVTVYWWAPEATDWSVTPLLPDTVPTAEMPVGKLTSSASAAGTLSVYGATEQSDVVRLAWEREHPEVGWTSENLSQAAQRQ